MQEQRWKTGCKSLSLNSKHVMGILNVTPDSFSDGGNYFVAEDAIRHAKEMLHFGAKVIDVGGQSTRPGYQEVSPDEEWGRIEEVLWTLVNETDAIISVDTYFPTVAAKALELGVHIINDVTGFDEAMFEIAAQADCGLVIMHGTGSKRGNITQEVRAFFEMKVKQAKSYEIALERLCFDPGIGFGKTYEENLELIANIKRIKIENAAFLMAASRKRVIAAAVESTNLSDKDIGTLTAHAISMAYGADIVRAHDVKNAVLSARVCEAIMSKKYGMVKKEK